MPPSRHAAPAAAPDLPPRRVAVPVQQQLPPATPAQRGAFAPASAAADGPMQAYVPHHPVQAEPSSSSEGGIQARLPAPAAQPRGSREPSYAGTGSNASSVCEGGGSSAAGSGIILSRAVPLQRVVSMMVAGPRTWSDKVCACARARMCTFIHVKLHGTAR